MGANKVKQKKNQISKNKDIVCKEKDDYIRAKRNGKDSGTQGRK